MRAAVDDAAGGNDKDIFAVDVPRALAALRFTWEPAYEIWAEDQWYARRADGRGGFIIAAKLPDQLNRELRADWDMSLWDRQLAGAW